MTSPNPVNQWNKMVSLQGLAVTIFNVFPGPYSTTSLIGVMLGLNITFKPVVTGRFILLVSASMYNTAAGDGQTMGIYYGKGTPPPAGSAITGTHVGTSMRSVTANANARDSAMDFGIILENLNIGQLWIDLGQTVITGGTANAINIDVGVIEV